MRRKRWLELVVAAVFMLNIADAAFTILWTTTGLATEANPLLADLLTRSPLEFMLLKLVLVSLCLLLLWRHRVRRFAVGALITGAVAYTLLFVVHLHAVPQLFALAD